MSKIALLSQEIERLNSKFSEEYGHASSKIQDLSRREQQLGDEVNNYNRKIAEYENKVNINRSEIQRLNETLETRTREFSQAKQVIEKLTKDNEEMRYKLRGG